MICKFCNAEIEQEQTVCPVCGKSLTEDQPAAEATPEELETSENETVMIAPAEDVETQTAPVESESDEISGEAAAEASEQEKFVEEMPEQQPAAEKTKGRKIPLVLSIIAAVAALASLALLLMIALGVDFKGMLPRKNDIFNKDSYTVADKKAAKKGDVVVATMGGKELTNAHLQIYYRMQVLDFLNYYGNYASQLGLDLNTPLSEQECYFEKEKTWEQYLLGVAIETWKDYQAVALLAEEAGFVLPAEWQDSLNELPDNLAEQAKEADHETVDALLKDVIGPACTEELYMEYVKLAYTCNAYYAMISEQAVPTDEEIDAYFEKNAATLAEEGITKEMGNISDVRHILVCPKGGAADDTTGETTYSEEEWAACLAEAEKILDEWKNGDATEESFAELANTYTEDPGSSTTGGLYEDIAPGASYVENFLNWAIDMNRQTGDTEIVKTEYGYHIMYYVEGEPYWLEAVGAQLQSERVTQTTDEAKEKWPLKVNYRKIAMSELKLS